MREQNKKKRSRNSNPKGVPRFLFPPLQARTPARTPITHLYALRMSDETVFFLNSIAHKFDANDIRRQYQYVMYIIYYSHRAAIIL